MKKIRKQIIMAISMVFLVLAVCSVAAAADVSNNGTTVQAQDQTTNQQTDQNSTNTGSISTNTVESHSTNQNSSNDSSVNTNTIKQPSKVVISGKVKKCSDGSPFEGVTVTAEKDGTKLASTTTNEDGTYSLEFQSDGGVFNVTASYPGHNSSTKEVNVIPNSNNTLQGSADFQLGPADGDTYVFNGWATDPTQFVTFPDGTTINGLQPGAYTNIADGVANAAPGRTVYIADGDGPYVGPNNRGITINKNLNIVGQSQAGTVIDAQGADRIFTIDPGFTVTIQDLTLTNGFATGVFPNNSGGAILNNGANLTVNDCTFNNNFADNGGAIYTPSGTLNVNRCTFTGNTAAGVGGAIANSFSTVNVTDSTFTGNTAGSFAGAIDNFRGTVNVSNSIFTGNTAGALGGVISNSGTVNVTNSAFTNNHANSNGGAIWNDFPGILNVRGSNFTGNTAGSGGAVSVRSSTANLHFNRIVGNSPSNSEVVNQSGTVDATLNWWGSNTSPAGKVQGNVLFNPWLVLSITSNPTVIFNGGTSQVTADLLHDSNGVYHDPALGHVPDGIPITLEVPWGSFTSSGITHSISLNTVNGSVTATFYANEGATPQPPLNPVQVAATADGYTTTDEESAYITILTPPSVITIGSNTSILSPHQSQHQGPVQTQTQTSINTNTNNLTNNNINTSFSDSSAVNTNNITNSNAFNPIMALNSSNYV